MTTLYYHHLKINPAEPLWSERDRLILSKGHAAPLLYSILGDKGFFDKNILKDLDFKEIENSLTEDITEFLKGIKLKNKLFFVS